jgi:hypothetical protein
MDGQGNQILCKVPVNYTSIANAYCHGHNKENCPEFPYTLIYLTDEYTENVECL